MNVLERAQAPTPKFFKVLRSIGLIVAAVGGAIVTAPVALPVALVTIGGYLTVAGGVLSTISQITVDDKDKPEGSKEAPDE
uniref:Holin n=1 Tax=Olivibacter ginsenosidimutans TaxID=1176537 RepID=A0ABP9BGQ3_9SPHI